MDINEILAKPGREWTDEEIKIVREAIKQQGRQSLKNIREELRNE